MPQYVNSGRFHGMLGFLNYFEGSTRKRKERIDRFEANKDLM